MSRVRVSSPDDEICITGISGVFPKSKNIDEFEHNLYNKVNNYRLSAVNFDL